MQTDAQMESSSTAISSTEASTPEITSSKELVSKKYYIKTFGCQMNVADSERMASLLSDKGLTPASEIEDANVILINGCTVREKAVHKALSIIGKYGHQLERAHIKKPIIGIGGCVGQLEKGELFAQAPYLDFVFGTDTIDHLPEMLHRVESGEKHVVFADFDKTNDYSTETKVFGKKAQAFVNIMKGCDKYCTYCVVPFTRGKEKSRTIKEVVDDIARLVATGVREITLLGQNVNSFGKGNANTNGYEPLELHNIIGKVGPRAGEENFPQLLRQLDTDPRLEKLKWIRFTSSHPLDFSDELIDCYTGASDLQNTETPISPKRIQKLTNHLHLPVQSGSNRILQKMGRHHKIEGYIAQMDQLRKISPDVSITTDLIVGFPGETEEDFQETLNLLDRIQYDSIYAFAYSPRPGTRAEKLVDDVSVEEKNTRLNRLLNHQAKISEAQYQKRVGKILEVMVDGEAKKQTLVEKAGFKGKVWTAKTSCFRVVNFADDSGRNLTGQFLKVKILRATGLSMVGEVVHDANEAENLGLNRETIKYDSLMGSEIVS